MNTTKANYLRYIPYADEYELTGQRHLDARTALRLRLSSRKHMKKQVLHDAPRRQREHVGSTVSVYNRGGAYNAS